MTSVDPYLTVVDTAAASKDLTVKATVKAELGITDTASDDQIDTNIHQASALIVRYCLDREFAKETVIDSFRPTSYCSPDTLRLSRTPVGDIEEVIENGTVLDDSLYEVNASTGELWRLDSSGNRYAWTTGGLITVEYDGGYTLLTELPHDVERACIDTVKAMFQSRQRDPTLKSESVPDVYQASYALAGGDFVGTSGLLKSVEGALAQYRRMVV